MSDDARVDMRCGCCGEWAVKPVELQRRPDVPAQAMLRVTRRGINVAECTTADDVAAVLAEHGVRLDVLE